MAITTLSDLVFHIREVSAGRSDLVSARLTGGLETLSTSDFLANVHSLVLALEDLGVAPGDRVAIFSENRPEWATVDFACQLLGAPTVPLYPALSAEQAGFVLRNSGSRLVFYSDGRKRDLLIQVQSALTSPLQVIAFEADATIEAGITLTRLMGRGAARRGEVPLERFRDRVGEDDLASIVYTSGTTGDPKGVMLSHRNLVASFLAYGELFQVGAADLALSCLPLPHVFQRTVDHLCFFRGAAIHYVPRARDVPRALVETRPTVLTSLPWLYERAYARTLADLGRQNRARRLLGRWAVGVGKRVAAERSDGFVGPFLALQRRLAEVLVLRRIRAGFGGRLRLPICGAAPLAPEVGEFFEAIGMPLFEGYGLTEASPVLTTNSPWYRRRGSVGRPLGEVEVRLAADGEILAKGPGVTQGYWENPEATRRVVDDEGWLHTGDVGELDDSGYLFITDRKKELLVTAGGESIAAQPIESRLMSHGLISQAVVVGDGRPFPAVLVVPDFERLAETVGEEAPPEELVEHPAARREIAAAVAEVNSRLGPHEQLRRFKLLGRELTLEAGELTPTLRIRRRVVTQRYAEEIAALYRKSQKAEG